MNERIIECVPNFSEGRDLGKVKEITDAIESVPEVSLLDVDAGIDSNRTVVTFIGMPEAVKEAAFRAIEKASQIIDMRKHRGAHPRIGATDVVPFVPVEGVKMAECVIIAGELAKRVGEELLIPVYLYEEAASSPQRRNLADIRLGEYEGLEKKLKNPAWKPDYGPCEFNARSGATIIGAREFLIAYNITLNSTDRTHATDIAFELRKKGRVARTGNTKPFYNRGSILYYREGAYPCGNCEFVGKTYKETRVHCQEIHGYDLAELLRENGLEPGDLLGKKVYRAGKFDHCKAIGWYVDEYKRSQISVNLTNYMVTQMHSVLDEARRLAEERGLVVTGSEIIGLIPYQALIETGKHYLRMQGKSTGVPATDILRIAVFSLGLNDTSEFDVKKKVLGLPQTPEDALVCMKVNDFADEISRGTPTPGGGSVAAIGGAFGASLVSMVANLAHGKPANEKQNQDLNTIAERAQALKDLLIKAVDADARAFRIYLKTLSLPSTTLEEQEVREQEIQQGLKTAVEVPWQTALTSFESLKLAQQTIQEVDTEAITDAAVGAQIGFVGVRGGIWNVLINLKKIKDRKYITEMCKNCNDLLCEATNILNSVTAYADKQLRGSIYSD